MILILSLALGLANGKSSCAWDKVGGSSNTDCFEPHIHHAYALIATCTESIAGYKYSQNEWDIGNQIGSAVTQNGQSWMYHGCKTPSQSTSNSASGVYYCQCTAIPTPEPTPSPTIYWENPSYVDVAGNYIVATENSNCADNGKGVITDLTECGDAAAALGTGFSSASTSTKSSGVPEGCYIYHLPGHANIGPFVNTQSGNVGNGSAVNWSSSGVATTRSQICKDTPAPTPAPTPDPTPAPTPSPTAYWDNSNYVTSAGDYEIAEEGKNCADIGKGVVTDLTECGDAAAALGTGYSTANTSTAEYAVPEGCYIYNNPKHANNGPFVNSFSGNIGQGSAVVGDITRSQICKVTPAPTPAPSKPPTQPPSKPPTQPPTHLPTVPPTAATFFEVTTKCADEGLIPITTSATCSRAAKILGKSDTDVSDGTNSARPEGCYYRELSSTTKLWLNGLAGAVGNGSDAERNQLCQQDEYIEVDNNTGNCNDAGYDVISDTATCEEAAKALGFADQGAGTTTNEPRPEGCYYRELSETHKLWVNDSPDSVGNGADESRHPLCKKRPPTPAPTKVPSNTPTAPPTKPPSKPPTKPPTEPPSNAPSNSPTNTPSQRPTNKPSNDPTNPPTNQPSQPPTVYTGVYKWLTTDGQKCDDFGMDVITDLTECGQAGKELGTGYDTANTSTVSTSYTVPEGCYSYEPVDGVKKGLYVNLEEEQKGQGSQTSAKLTVRWQICKPRPTDPPTVAPSNSPSNTPSQRPTNRPSNDPTNPLTDPPSVAPSNSPTNTPSQRPTNRPTNPPTSEPTPSPTDAPAVACSDFDGDRKGCRNIDTAVGYEDLGACVWTSDSTCRPSTCSDYKAKPKKCGKEAKKKGKIVCYYDLEKDTCQEVLPTLDCAGIRAQSANKWYKKYCKKLKSSFVDGSAGHGCKWGGTKGDKACNDN